MCRFREEWSAELLGSFSPEDLQAFFESSGVKFMSSGKVGGQQQWLFFAEQVWQWVGLMRSGLERVRAWY